MKMGHPPSALQPKKATEDFSPGTEKETCLLFQVSIPPIEMKGKLEVVPLWNCQSEKRGCFIQALQSSLRLEGLD